MKLIKKLGSAAVVGLTCLTLLQVPAFAAGPLISGTETDDTPAAGPALEDASAAAGSAGGASAGTSEEAEGSAAVSQEALNDNLIEYNELEALVRTGNAEALNQESSYQDSLANYQTAYDAFVTSRRDMLNKADETEDEGGAETLITSYEQSAAILSSSVSQMKRSLTSLQSISRQTSRNQVVWALLKTTQTLMGSYKEMEGQTENAEKTAEAAQSACDTAALKREAGLITEEELLQAEKTLLSAQISLQSLQDSTAQLKRQLAVMIGRDADSIQIGELPAVEETELSALNLETDKAKAIVESSSVKSLKKTTAVGDANRKLRRRQIAEAEGNASISADEQFNQIAALSLERTAAQAAFAAAEKDYGALQTKYSAGLINKTAYLEGEADYLQKKAAKEAAEIDLRTAVDGYNWMLKGAS